VVVGETENGKFQTAGSVTQCGRRLSLGEARSACFLIVTPSVLGLDVLRGALPTGKNVVRDDATV
jgi:hypothetical protein